MKRRVIKQDLVDTVLKADSRTASWDEKQVDKAITNAFVELLTLDAPFSREKRVPLAPLYESGEKRGIIPLEYSVITIYDMYLMKELEDDTIYLRGEKKNAHESVIWRNPQAKDQVYYNLDSSYIDDIYDFAIIKYFYVPTDANFTELFLNSDEYVALDIAIEVATLAQLKDYKGADMVRRRLELLGGNLNDVHPTDPPAAPRRIFGGYADV